MSAAHETFYWLFHDVTNLPMNPLKGAWLPVEGRGYFRERWGYSMEGVWLHRGWAWLHHAECSQAPGAQVVDLNPTQSPRVQQEMKHTVFRFNKTQHKVLKL